MQRISEIRLKGLPLSGGRVVGKVCMFNEDRHSNLPMYHVEGEGVEKELARVERAIRLAGERLDAIRNRVRAEVGEAESEIFVAQKMILDDKVIHAQMTEAIRDRNMNAESAVGHVLNKYESRLAELDDEYIRTRATDIGEVKRRLLDVLGNMRPQLQCDKGHCQRGRDRIIVAEELTPSLTVDIDPVQTLAFVTEHGGVNSHAAILARALGIPAVSGLVGIRDVVGCGAELVVNGDTGEVIAWPSEATVSTLGSIGSHRVAMPDAVDPVAGFKVMGNINLSSEMGGCVEMKAEGVGLYRTEFEIMAAGRFFGEDELYERYISVRRAAGDADTVFRLFDIGSDKTLPFMQIPREENPSLGWRGARLLLGKKDILVPQARALARASLAGPIHVLYPMIVDLDQFVKLKEAFIEAIDGVDCGEIKHGIMFEVPSACAQARELFEHIDFGSVGTNDLTQYFFAVDRENELVSYDYDPDRPVFWSLLRGMAEAANDAGKPLSVCGEMAGTPEFAGKFISIGISTVSVTPRRIPEVRRAADAVMNGR